MTSADTSTAPPPAPDERQPRPLEAGQLTTVWSTLLAVSWGLIIAALIALGTTSSKIGKPTWWLGDQPSAGGSWTWLIPFVLPALALAAAATNHRLALPLSATASVSLLVVGLFDLGRSPGVAVGELALAVAGVLVTVAGLAGRLRPAPTPADPASADTR